MTPCVTLSSGQTNRTIDAGLYTLPPLICVSKEVACLLPGNLCGPFAKTAIGYKSDSQLPGLWVRRPTGQARYEKVAGASRLRTALPLPSPKNSRSVPPTMF